MGRLSHLSLLVVVFAITVFVVAAAAVAYVAFVIAADVVIAVEISECGAGYEQCWGRLWALFSSSLLAPSPLQILLCPG